MQSQSDELIMTIQPKVIDHLGINMYTNLHSVISELIANSYDADANNVWIEVPEIQITGDYKITIKDDGIGMSFYDVNSMYLQVGRNKRDEIGDNPTLKEKRKTLGRKGIGKFSVFGIAKEVTIKAVRDGSVTEFQMDIDKIKGQAEGGYKPHPVRIKQPTSEGNGVTVTLEKLKRKNAINIPQLREGVANRFMLFSGSFKVYLNGKQITQADMDMGDIEFTKEIDEPVSPTHTDWMAKGTIWGKKGTIREAHNRGVSLFARGKLVQEPTFFGATSGKEYAYPHLFGRLTVDFVDGKNDVIGTNRSSINWESEEGQEIEQWGKKKLTEMSIEFFEKRIEEKKRTITSIPEISSWLSDLPPVERKTAKKVVDTIASNIDLSEERAKDLVFYVKGIFNYNTFQELADQISNQDANQAPLIIDLFRQWEHVESREMYKILKGRMQTIVKLKEFIEKDAKEVPTIHNYLREFPWILDPRWTIVYDEVKYSQLLRENFKEDDKLESDRRIDFLCFSSGPTMVVVELKRPGKPISEKDLEQIEKYVLFVGSNLAGNDPDISVQQVFGYLICEKQQKGRNIDLKKKKTNLARNGIYIRTYSELLGMAERIHGEFTQRYAEIKELTKEGSALKT